jgi:DNA-binding CsgD family transcriptional regulator
MIRTGFSATIRLKIFKLLKKGYSTKQIAEQLDKPVGPLEKHIRNNRQYYHAN